MYIEKETYIVKPFVKRSFLNQQVSAFTDNLGNADFSKVMSIIRQNKSVLLPNKLLNRNKDTIRIIFDKISSSITNDECVDKEEIYDFIRGYYKHVKKQDVSDEQIGKLKVFDMLDILIVWMKGYNNPAYRKRKVNGN